MLNLDPKITSAIFYFPLKPKIGTLVGKAKLMHLSRVCLVPLTGRKLYFGPKFDVHFKV